MKKFFLILGILILILIPVEILNFTGFCYSEMRYFSEQELIDRHLFKDQASTLSYDEKVKIMMDMGYEYPYAFYILGEPWYIRKTERFFNKLVGWFYYQEISVAPDQIWVSSLNACGSKSHTEYGEQITPQEYEKKMRRRKEQYPHQPTGERP